MSKATFRRIRLELGRTAHFPVGSASHGYEFVAPLTADGHLAADAWRTAKDKCVVRRFWSGEPDIHGYLRHVGRGWRFDYQKDTRDDDEPLFNLDRHPLVPDNYVSVTENDGIQRPFRVVLVTPEIIT
jgi:hypothetical protein